MGFDHEDPDARRKRGRSLPTKQSIRTGFDPKLAAAFSVTPLCVQHIKTIWFRHTRSRATNSFHCVTVSGFSRGGFWHTRVLASAIS